MSGTRTSSHPRNVVTRLAVLLLPLAAGGGGRASAAEPARQPLHRTVDLDRGETVRAELPDGGKATVKLLDVEETRDPLRSAIREARVKLEVNGRPVTLPVAMYHLPRTVAGVQIDCPVTRGFYKNCDPFEDSWGLERDARLRLWPAGSPWAEPGTFAYPARQCWFASATQIGNEPSFVDGGDLPHPKRGIYYHSGNDIGGCEGLTDVVSACDGLVVSAGGKALPGHGNAPFYKPRGDYDYVYVLDARGWYYRYAHLLSIDRAVRPGARVKTGQKIGVLGKEGSSGGWAHLHFDVKAKQPSGKWGIEDAYPFLWEAYHRGHKPQLVAVARPHHLVAAGEKATLDGSRSWSAAGGIARYQWTFGDGSTAEGATVERTYRQPGSYSEVLKVTDARGRVEYDFATVQVIGKDQKEQFPPTIHASYAPTFDVRAGDPVTFKVRTFRAPVGNETWDFGDGSPPEKVRSDGNAKPHAPDGYAETVHRFAKPGHYLVRVEGTGHGGARATTHLAVRVGEKPGAPQQVNGAAPSFEITVAAGRHDRTNAPVRVRLPPGQVGDGKTASVVLAGPDGKPVPAQWTRPGLTSGDGGEFHFLLPHLAAGESVRLTATLSPEPPGGVEGYTWKDQPGHHTDLLFGKRPVLSYHYERLDTSTPASRVRTYKVFHHLYSPGGDRVVTNGLSDDPKVHSPHHRGIFYGFNRIRYGDGKTADTWHCTDGAYQEHDRFLAADEGPVLGRHRVAVRWHGRDAAFAVEERELTAYNVPGGHLVEFASRMRATAGPVRLDGDPQHAGFQFRAHNDVDALTARETIFVRPDGVGKPGETRNWDPATRRGPVDLPWNAMSFVLGGKRYTVAYLDHPTNPKEARFSERDYGRFGSYFEYTIDKDKPLTVNYRLWLQEGLMKPEEVAALSKNFVEPVEVTVRAR